MTRETLERIAKQWTAEAISRARAGHLRLMWCALLIASDAHMRAARSLPAITAPGGLA